MENLKKATKLDKLNAANKDYKIPRVNSMEDYQKVITEIIEERYMALLEDIVFFEKEKYITLEDALKTPFISSMLGKNTSFHEFCNIEEIRFSDISLNINGWKYSEVDVFDFSGSFETDYIKVSYDKFIRLENMQIEVKTDSIELIYQINTGLLDKFFTEHICKCWRAFELKRINRILDLYPLGHEVYKDFETKKEIEFIEEDDTLSKTERFIKKHEVLVKAGFPALDNYQDCLDILNGTYPSGDKWHEGYTWQIMWKDRIHYVQFFWRSPRY